MDPEELAAVAEAAATEAAAVAVAEAEERAEAAQTAAVAEAAAEIAVGAAGDAWEARTAVEELAASVGQLREEIGTWQNRLGEMALALTAEYRTEIADLRGLVEGLSLSSSPSASSPETPAEPAAPEMEVVTGGDQEAVTAPAAETAAARSGWRERLGLA